MADLVFGIRLTADGSGFVGNVRIAREEVEKLGQASRQAGQQVGTSMTAMTGAVAAGQLLGQVISDAARSLVNYALETVASAAALKNLSDMTGSTVEDLSRLSNVAKVSGTDSGSLTNALEKLAVGLSGTDEGSKKAGKALAALGISSRDPARAMQELAQKFAGYADDANKAAWANEIFGRGGAKLLPLLKDLAEQQDIAGTVTRQQAEDAEKLEKNLRKLSLQANSLRDALLGGLVPALNNLNEQFLVGINLAGGFWKALVNFGTINPFKSLDENLTSTRERIAKLEKGEGFEAWGARGHGKTDELLQMLRAREQFLLLQKKQEADAKFGEWSGDVNDMRARAATPSLGGTPAAGAGRGKAEVDEYAKALAQVNKIAVDAKLALEGVFAPDNLTRSTKALAELEASPAWGKIPAAGREIIKSILGQSSALELEKRRWDDAADAAAEFAKQQAAEKKRWDEEVGRNKESVNDLVAALDLETQSMFQTNEERERAIALSKILYTNETEYEEQVKRVNEAFDRRNNAAALKKSLDDQAAEFKKTYDQISDTITDALMRGFEGGKDWAKNFIDTLKNMFGTLVLRPIIQAIVAPVAGSITSLLSGGASAATGGAGGLGSIANLFGGGGGGLLGNLFGGMGATSALGPIVPTFGSSLLAGISSPLSTLATLFSGGGPAAFGGGPAALGAGLGAAVPFIGAGLLAYSLLAKKGGGPMTREYATSGADFTDLLSAHRIPGSDAVVSSQYQSLLAQQQTDFKRLLDLFKGTGSAAFALYSSQDPRGTASNQLDVRALVNGKAAYTANIEDQLGRYPAALQARIALESKRAVLAALQASDLPDTVGAVLQTLTASSATDEQIDNLLSFATALGTVAEAIGGNVAADAQKAWETSQRTSVDALRDMGAEVTKLAGQLDGSSESMAALATATGNYRQAVVQTLSAINQIRQQLSQTFAASREQIEFAGLSKEDAFGLYRSKGAALMRQIGEADDPEAVKKLGEKFNSYFMSAFQLLAPEEQLANKQDFLASLTSVDRAIDNRLTSIAATIGTDTAGPFATAQKALDDVAGKMQKAATTQAEAAAVTAGAADKIAGAASALLAAAATPIRVAMLDTRGSEIGGG